MSYHCYCAQVFVVVVVVFHFSLESLDPDATDVVFSSVALGCKEHCHKSNWN